jgi:hypothetical protein
MNSFRRRTLVSLAMPLAIAGCNYFLDLDTAQCKVTSDCRSLGAGFENTQCISGSCVAAQSSAGSTGAEPPIAEEGGAGGAPSSGGCTSNAQCVADNMGEPYACLVPGEPCVPLKTEECPLVFGDYEHENAVYFGAFLNVPATSPLSQMSTLNVRLAVDEFNGSVGGLPGGPLGKLRPLVSVVCRNEPELVEAGAQHLVDSLHVPAVLSHLPSADNKRFFVDHALDARLLVINPGFADNSLTALSNAGLFWHVIGDIRDVGAAYVPLLGRIETYLAKTEPLRVALLVSKRYAEESIANTITPLLRFNGKTVIDNGENFFSASVTALSDDPAADYAPVNESLLAFRPHVMIALTREEFVYKILPAVEGGWSAAAPGQGRPFYVLPNALSGNLDLLNYVGLDSGANTSEMKRRRFVGVAPASAEDLALYNQFLVRFRTAYPRFENPGGFENFYDAVYLLANAMFAAGSVPSLTGPDIARGMQRIISGNLNIDVGPTTIADGFSALAAGGSIRIKGTMGPADFDPGVGARRSNGSVYCIQRTGPQLSFAYDVLRYDSGNAALSGEFPCFAGF